MASQESEDEVPTTAVAIGKDKNSQYAVRWTVEKLMKKDDCVILVHVRTQSVSQSTPHLFGFSAAKSEKLKGQAVTPEDEIQHFFLPYRGFCSRKGVRTMEIVLYDIDVCNALVDFINENSISNLVLGASTRSALRRAFRNKDVATSLSKFAPAFCSIHAVSKGKSQNIRPATQSCPSSKQQTFPNLSIEATRPRSSAESVRPRSSAESVRHRSSAESVRPRSSAESVRPRSSAESVRHRSSAESVRHRSSAESVRPRSSAENTLPEKNLRGMSTESTSSESPNHNRSDYMQPASGERYSRSSMASPQRQNIGSDASPQRPSRSPNRYARGKGGSSNQDYVDTGDFSAPPSFQSTDLVGENYSSSRMSDNYRSSNSPISSRDLESEMRNLRMELKKTMEMYSSATKEATFAREKAKDVDKWKSEEALKLQEAKEAHEAALALAEIEKQKTKAAMEAAHMAQQIAELEVQKRKNMEMKVLYEAEERKRSSSALSPRPEMRYRKYNIEDIEIATEYFSESMKIGEGGYGPVYKASLDHTAVAIKVLRPDASQGKKQFEKEVEILSYIRHPNMVLLLGACPEYGCLVYEYMENGSLEDRIFRKDNTPPMSWQSRFRIAAEIATSLLFLHQTKPEPLVHRDLKPANILLDQNYVSKIGDVGLSRLVPPSVADNITQYHLTAAAGTFCYIDPEYQQTGMLGVKSDIYSFGILLLQVITAKPAMGLTHYIERALAKGTLADLLDPQVPDWPVEEALCFAKLALKCCELRRKDRPDLGTVILPELKRLSNFGLKNGADRGPPSPYVKSVFNSRQPFPEAPKGKSYCGVPTETEKSALRKDGECKTSMHLGSALANKFIDKREG